jgi:acyl carrier protein
VAAAEREFGLTVPDDELRPEYFETVGTFVTFIEQRLG